MQNPFKSCRASHDSRPRGIGDAIHAVNLSPHRRLTLGWEPPRDQWTKTNTGLGDGYLTHLEPRWYDKYCIQIWFFSPLQGSPNPCQSATHSITNIPKEKAAKCHQLSRQILLSSHWTKKWAPDTNQASNIFGDTKQGPRKSFACLKAWYAVAYSNIYYIFFFFVFSHLFIYLFMHSFIHLYYCVVGLALVLASTWERRLWKHDNVHSNI